MIFRQVLRSETGCAAYVFGCGGQGRAAVVDPQFDVDDYIAIASARGMKIEAILCTHVHADHRSGERELSERTGAPIYYHRSADIRYPFTAIDDGSEISLGNVVVRALHTPGHTPESTSYLVTDRTRCSEPWMVFTGDTLFVGDVGRSDFGGETAAGDLFTSLHETLLVLPDYVEVYPAHISGSPCGRSMSGKPSSTIGFERRHNPSLLESDRGRFIEAMTGLQPPRPAGFFETIAMNRGG